MTRRRPPRLALTAVGLGLIAMPWLGCGDSSGGLFGTSCSDLGKKPADLSSSVKVTPLVVLIDVNSNTAAMAKRISDDVAGVIGDVTDSAPDIVITGYTSGGVGTSLKKIGCMNTNEYVFVGGNERRQDADRTELKTQLATAIDTAVRATKVASTGDSRVLLRQVSTIVKPDQQAKVILWSTFLAQGTDCLAFDPGQAPSDALAGQVADRCATQNLLPTLSGASVTIVGAGLSDDRPELTPFGKSLALKLLSEDVGDL